MHFRIFFFLLQLTPLIDSLLFRISCRWLYTILFYHFGTKPLKLAKCESDSRVPCFILFFNIYCYSGNRNISSMKISTVLLSRLMSYSLVTDEQRSLSTGFLFLPFG
uniref:Secreted protein n=1 Tax=Pararge aegeria TaxID=116150 RepID=S4PW35_9NEOP